LASALDRSIDPERWALHRALAAIGPDEEAAAALEESAVLARARGGYTAESELLSRAAELTPVSHDRSRRLLGAAYAANLSGDSPRAQQLLDEARKEKLDELDQARAQLLDGMVSVPIGRGSRAPALLLEAAKSFAPLNPELSRRALLASFSALLSASQCAEGTTGGEIGEVALAALSDVEEDSTIDSLLRGVASSFVSDYPEATSALRRSLATLRQMSAAEITEWFYLGPFMANVLWDPDSYRFVAELLETAARQQGAILVVQFALMASAAEDVREGRFSAARIRYAELLEITEAVGGPTSFFSLLDVELAAWEGEEEATRSKIHDLIQAATAFGSGTPILNGHYAMAILELGLGQYERALTAAQALEEARMPAWSPFALPLIVEAAMRCTDVEAAQDALIQITERAQAVQTPFALGLMWRCRALVKDDDQTESAFASAIECFEKSPWKTELARTHLLLGEWLRRKKRRTEARDQLRTAYDFFAAIGARAFAERTRFELEATGERARSRRIETTTDLTVRELQIARLAANGLTSREIASQLFISPNTVEYHLKKVFQKLGVRSRIQLAKAIPDVS
jgi:DNA-binding CsgD family transcriptional regulator